MSSQNKKMLLTANLMTSTAGAVTALDVIANLDDKPGYTINSWFVIGHFESEGHTFNYLMQMMALSIKGFVVAVGGAASVTDETTGQVIIDGREFTASGMSWFDR